MLARLAAILPYLLGTVGLLAGCGTNYAELPTYSVDHHLVQAVVEVPAGTNHVQQYDPATRQFQRTQHAGIDQLVEFLPYPGNFGFIPGTHTTASPRYPAGQPLPVLILSESQVAGTVLEITPIGVVLLDEDDLLRQVVLAVPARPGQRILPGVATWATLRRDYPTVRATLGDWLQHRGGNVRLVGWKDEIFAQQQIKEAQ